MHGKTPNKVHNRNLLCHKDIILVPVIVEGDKITIIVINARGSNNRASQIASDIFDGIFWRKVSRFCIYIKAVFMFFVNGGFYCLKGRPDFLFKPVGQDGLEGIPHKFVREEIFLSPFHAIGNKTMYMGIPF